MKRRDPVARRKGDLPSKLCACCQRPMLWRRKWAEIWEEVRYCSERCRRNRNRHDAQPAAPTPQTRPIRHGRRASP